MSPTTCVHGSSRARFSLSNGVRSTTCTPSPGAAAQGNSLQSISADVLLDHRGLVDVAKRVRHHCKSSHGLRTAPSARLEDPLPTKAPPALRSGLVPNVLTVPATSSQECRPTPNPPAVDECTLSSCR
eukprot:5316309-Pyramimonas_sp.AAC.1